jgi:hypothetical protein
MEKWALLDMGRNRAVYAHGRFVIKVPCRDQGYSDNHNEARISRKYGRGPDLDGILYARCRLLANGWLVMERLDVEYIPPEVRPRWADFVDCAQVGRTRDGRIVAYDFGNHY